MRFYGEKRRLFSFRAGGFIELDPKGDGTGEKNPVESFGENNDRMLRVRIQNGLVVFPSEL